MAATTSHSSDSNGRSLRVAIEGCGHGTLDAIYSSITQSCKVKGWDGVDLVIIGGDFQAVRNKYDLNVTAMPAKFRQMADFHNYYSGTKKAPYLTIFIGGNHEASNYLWELYYGGWVAPKIYYLGAANVIQVGPVKIAGMSGIWKGPDYRKTHYERLPYNSSTMRSIYHVRELDTRKLLAYRSQVDIGMSHDWPRHIEFHGNREQLFRYKQFLRDDSDSGRLGSTAAENVMDHLRPAYWFSAHLHAKYWAVKDYNQIEAVVVKDRRAQASDPRHARQFSPRSDQQVVLTDRLPTRNNRSTPRVPSTSENQEQVSAWQAFSNTVALTEAEENAKIVEAQKERREQLERNGLPASNTVTYETTYKKVKLSNGFGREITSISQHQSSEASGDEVYDEQQHVPAIPQLDGCCPSLPMIPRHIVSTTRLNTQPKAVENLQINSPFVGRQNGLRYQALSGDDEQDNLQNGFAHAATDEAASKTTKTQDVANPDAIDIDMSDEDDNNGRPDGMASIETNEASTLLQNKDANKGTNKRQLSPDELRPSCGILTSIPGDESTHINQVLYEPMEGLQSTKPSTSHNKILKTEPTDVEYSTTQNSQYDGPDEDCPELVHTDENNQDVVSEEMRTKLAALSSKFAETEKIEISPSLPHPESIYNKRTRFLALSKCESKQEFLQLCEIETLAKEGKNSNHPIKLRYDPEWLAVQRVFASELSLGGSGQDKGPAHRGDTYYRDKIIEEEKWIQENVVQKDLLDIPENFSITAEIYDPNITVEEHDMPQELSNPQTTAYCKLIGIENKFDFSQEDRDARMAAGPGKSEFSGDQHGSRNHRGGRGRGGRGGLGNRGGRGGSSRGGRGRGRGGRH